MRKLPQAGTDTVRVPRTANHPARTVTLSVRFAQVKVSAPKTRRGEPPLTVWGVVGEEIASDPNQKERIFWCLLTTVPVHTLADAIERIQWYVKRWTIEEYHRVLKSGCQVEARQLSTRVRLQRALAVDIVVAWRIMNLSKAARLQPDAPADQWLSTNEWQALYCYVHQTRDLPTQPPRIADAVGWIAQLGGFLARRSDGHPGTTTLWRGMQRLNDIVASWQIFGPSHRTSRRPTTRPKKPLKRCG
jgi:Transposase Tn5 dimerisation domain